MSLEDSGRRLMDFYNTVFEDESLWLRLRTDARGVIEESEVLEVQEKDWLLRGETAAVEEALRQVGPVGDKIFLPFKIFLASKIFSGPHEH